MVISLKDGLKLIGIAIISFCAVFVCTFFINYYVDAVAVGPSVEESLKQLYEAQLATAKLSCTLSGCCLLIIALLMLVFYIKMYVDGHARQLGIMKAMGYTNGEIALKFWVFGFGVFLGAALGCGAGYAIMPLIYSQMTVEGLKIPIRFNFWLPLVMVLLPAAIFSAFSCGYAYLALKRPVGDMLRGKTSNKLNRTAANKKRATVKADNNGKQRSFLFEMGLKTLTSKKMLVFFVAFACFCFSAMVQMGGAMYDFETQTMGPIILVLGIVLAVTTLFIAITALVRGNVKNIAIMKAFGYSVKECAATVFLGYVPFAFLGFGIGTVYQYAILRVMVDLFFEQFSLTFKFSVPIFFITLASFIVFYVAVMALYVIKIGKVSVKEVMAEE